MINKQRSAEAGRVVEQVWGLILAICAPRTRSAAEKIKRMYIRIGDLFRNTPPYSIYRISGSGGHELVEECIQYQCFPYKITTYQDIRLGDPNKCPEVFSDIGEQLRLATAVAEQSVKMGVVILDKPSFRAAVAEFRQEGSSITTENIEYGCVALFCCTKKGDRLSICTESVHGRYRLVY